MQSKATSVDQYLAELPDERRIAMAKVREVIRKNLPAGYEEGMQYGMIGYYIPRSVYQNTYNKQPLSVVGLASQKQYMSLYLMAIYTDAADETWFHDAWSKTGKRLDMGKCCVRFKRLEDLPLDLIGQVVRRVTPKHYIARYEESRASVKKASVKKASAK